MNDKAIEEELDKQELALIDEGLADVEAGRVMKHSDFVKELGIEEEVLRNRQNRQSNTDPTFFKGVIYK